MIYFRCFMYKSQKFQEWGIIVNDPLQYICTDHCVFPVKKMVIHATN